MRSLQYIIHVSVIEGTNPKYYKKFVSESSVFVFLSLSCCYSCYLFIIFASYWFFFFYCHIQYFKKKFFLVILFLFYFIFYYFFLLFMMIFFFIVLFFPREYYLLLRHATCISKKHLGRKFCGSWINAGRIDVDGIHKWLFVNIKWYLSRAFMQKMLAAGDGMRPGIFKVHKL